MRVKSGQTIARIPLDRIAPGFERAEIRFEGLRPPQSSYEARVYLDGHHVGSQYFYGLGAADAPAQSSRREIRLNITDGLRTYLDGTNPAARAGSLKIVAVDRDGTEISEPDLDLDGVSLITT